MAEKILPTPKEKRTQNYWALLNNIIDPEVGIGVVDLGLIYDVAIKDGSATVTMTLTSMGCPVGPSIMQQIKEEVEQFPGVKKATVNLVWDPVWTPDRIDPDVRVMLSV